MIDRVLVVGLGSIGQRHLRLLRERLPEAKIMVLRHRSSEKPIAEADVCTTSLKDALSFSPQISIIATPAPFHCQTAIALAQVGSHLLVEKPISTTALEARALATAADAAGVVLQVGYNLRQLDSLTTFREALFGGQIGRVASVRSEVGQYLADWRPGVDWRKSVSARAELGGGALLELSHELDYLRWLFGDVCGLAAWFGQQGGLDLNVEDTVHILLKFCSSTPLGATGAAPMASLSMDLIRRDTVRKCVAIGEDGTLTWDGIASKIWLTRPDGSEAIIFNARPDRDASYRLQIDSFLESVVHGTAVAVTALDAIAVMDLVEAARRSHAEGGTMVTPLVEA